MSSDSASVQKQLIAINRSLTLIILILISIIFIKWIVYSENLPVDSTAFKDEVSTVKKQNIIALTDSLTNSNTDSLHKKKPTIKLTVKEKVVNINTANIEKLCTLKGIGKTIAARIISYRTQNGNFKNCDDLMKVKGIGKKRYHQIKNNIKLK